ncbi:hypothetical protein VPH35_076543 [Triticum aestivum]|uniref:Wall-associated receptor kinase galacturonan-binding domain-containing protein n=1 Tax=Aegilops tauschii TaxID=37682 RepID=M8CU27_AEGTA
MATASTVWRDQDFFRHCPWFRCSKNGPEIRFPLQLESSNSSRGAICAKIECSGQDTVLLHPVLGPFNVTARDYSLSSPRLCKRAIKFRSSSRGVYQLTPTISVVSICYIISGWLCTSCVDGGYYLSLKMRYNKEIHLKVEMFNKVK